MKARKSGELLVHRCPGCNESHAMPVEGDRRWTWNGSLERPTLSPSVKHTTPAVDDPDWKIAATCCHYFLRDGRIEFCGDSTHALAGQTVELPEFPEPA